MYSAISLWLYDLSASAPWCPPLAFGPLTWKLIWLSSGAIVLAAERKAQVKHTVTISLFLPPLFLNPGLLFPWESQGHIWSSSVARAAARALKAEAECVCVCGYMCVCSLVTAPDRAHLVEGPSWSPCSARTLPLVPSGLMNPANSTGAVSSLSVVKKIHTHRHKHTTLLYQHTLTHTQQPPSQTHHPHSFKYRSVVYSFLHGVCIISV